MKQKRKKALKKIRKIFNASKSADHLVGLAKYYFACDVIAEGALKDLETVSNILDRKQHESIEEAAKRVMKKLEEYEEAFQKFANSCKKRKFED